LFGRWKTFHMIHLVCPCYETNSMICTGWILVMHRVFIACVAMHMYFGFVSRWPQGHPYLHHNMYELINEKYLCLMFIEWWNCELESATWGACEFCIRPAGRRYHGVYPGFCCIKQLGVHASLLISGWASYYRAIPGFNSLVPIYMYTPGWRETLRVVSRLRTARTVTQDQSIQSPVR